MINIKDIYWVAGILEGEGSFCLTNASTSPIIYLQMGDYDIVRRVRNIINPQLNIFSTKDNRSIGYKTMYRINIAGHQARGWMMTIYLLMSKRRQQKIKQLLLNWKTSPSQKRAISPQAKFRASVKKKDEKDWRIIFYSQKFPHSK